MLFYVAGRISGHATVEAGFRSPFNLMDFKSAIAANYGGVDLDYYVYSVDESNTDAVRIKNGDEWVAVWTGDVITGVDFSIEDAKKWIDVSVDKLTFSADNKEVVLVKASILLADKSDVDTSFDTNVDIPIKSSDSSYKIRFKFISGKASRAIKTSMAGTWKFPLSKVPGYRNNNTVSFESIQ